jgi:phage terminase large subunit-like protein
MITRDNAQFWVMSTVGFPGFYLRPRMVTGRSLVRSGRPSTTAYFEWSAPKDADPDDPETWWGCMPALGHTIRLENIQHARDTIKGGLSAFRRAYLNQWPDEFDDEEWVVPKLAWQACADAESRRVGLPVAAFDVLPGRAGSSVSVAGTRADGLPMVKLVASAEGAAWVPGQIGKMARERGLRSVVMDSVGAGSNLRQDVEEELKELREPVPLLLMKTGDVCDAWADFEDAVTTEQLRHLDQDVLTKALSRAVLRQIGKRDVLDSRASSIDITPVVACDHALWGLSNTPEPKGFFAATA